MLNNRDRFDQTDMGTRPLLKIGRKALIPGDAQ